jgi:hypothetical protein
MFLFGRLLDYSVPVFRVMLDLVKQFIFVVDSVAMPLVYPTHASRSFDAHNFTHGRNVEGFEAKGQFCGSHVAIVFVSSDCQRFVVKFESEQANKGLERVVVVVHFESVATANDSRLFHMRLENDCRNLATEPVPSVLDGADVVFDLEAPFAALPSFRAVLSEIEHDVSVTHDKLHRAESVISADTVVDFLDAHAWLPLLKEDFTVVDPNTS